MLRVPAQGRFPVDEQAERPPFGVVGCRETVIPRWG